MSATANAVLLPFASGECDCEPTVVGELSNGGNSTTPLNNSGANSVVGSATIINEGELPGLCNLGPEEACNTGATCVFNLKISVTITAVGSGTNDPASVKFGPFSAPITGVTGGGWTGTSNTKRYSDLYCEFQQNVTLKVKDSGGATLATANFTLQCSDCPAASGS